MTSKPCSQSLTVKTEYILPPDTNTFGTLFGGKLMGHIDSVAAISALRHARKPVVTASTDSVDFLSPTKEGDSICIEAFVTWTHQTSMEVFVKVVTEVLFTGARKVCATAFLTFVAVDEAGRPTTVPAVYPETDEEKELNKGGEQRATHRRARRKQSREMANDFGVNFPWDKGK